MNSIRNRVLELLRSYQGLSIPQSHLYRALGVSKSRISEVLNELESEGLISRTSVGRSKIIYVHPGISERVVEVEGKLLRIGLVYSSEYLFLGGLVKRLKDKGFSVEIVVYGSGLKATRALAEGAVHLALSPLVGQLYLYPVYKTYRIVLAGLKGGFRVLYKEGSSNVYSSIISTMDYARYQALNRRLIEVSKTIYYKDKENLRKALKKGGYVVTWHPLYLELERKGFQTLYTPQDLEEVDFCCTLAVTTTLNEKTRTTIEKIYLEVLEEYQHRPDKYLEYYSAITGVDTLLLKQAVKEYTIAQDLNIKTVDKIITTYTQRIPSKEAYYEAITQT